MKLCSGLLTTEVEFYWQKHQNRVLCHLLGDLGVMYMVHLWLVGKRVVDFLLVLIELLCQLSRLRHYEWLWVKIVVLERVWVTLSTNFTWHCLHHPTFSCFATIPACDRHTNTQTDT